MGWIWVNSFSGVTFPHVQLYVCLVFNKYQEMLGLSWNDFPDLRFIKYRGYGWIRTQLITEHHERQCQCHHYVSQGWHSNRIAIYRGSWYCIPALICRCFEYWIMNTALELFFPQDFQANRRVVATHSYCKLFNRQIYLCPRARMENITTIPDIFSQLLNFLKIRYLTIRFL